METVLAAVVLIALAMTGLAVGVLSGRGAIKGSCGGIACQGACHACPNRKGKEAP
ncbi:hypothetical protein [Aliihoeflea sp. PC F10.4]